MIQIRRIKQGLIPLEQVLEFANDDRQQLAALIGFSLLEYFEFDHEKCLHYADQAYTLATSLGIVYRLLNLQGSRVRCIRDSLDFDESIKILDEAYVIAKRNRYIYDYKRILNALAAAYILKADYDKALELNFESLLLREQEGDKAEISVALQNIGLVYFQTQEL